MAPGDAADPPGPGERTDPLGADGGTLHSHFAVNEPPSPEVATVILGGLRGVLDVGGTGPSEVQVAVVDALARRFSGAGLPSLADVEPVRPAELLEALPTRSGRSILAHTCVLLELLDHPVRPQLEAHVESYLAEMGVPVPELAIARDTARNQLVRLHADLVRNSWYTEQTMLGVATGRLWEYARSKLAYYGVVGDEHVAQRWEALGDCESGSWGRAVADFYQAHGFPFPGQRHGIYEIGALHDWVHVLADYSTDPDGEINVFAFISATMSDPRGFVQFMFTLALFQNASVSTVGGLPVKIARAGTLSDSGGADRLADAFWRASKCTADPMGGVDHFGLANEGLAVLRQRWSVVPKSVPSPAALEVVAPSR